MENNISIEKRCSYQPSKHLYQKAEAAGLEITSSEFASKMDSVDELRGWRNDFCYPRNRDLPPGLCLCELFIYFLDFQLFKVSFILKNHVFVRLYIFSWQNGLGGNIETHHILAF